MSQFSCNIAPGFVSDQTLWDLWGTEWHLDKFLFEVPWLSPFGVIRPMLYNHSFIHSFLYHRCYTECNRKNGPNFGRVFLMLNYTEKTQNTYVQSLTVWEIMAIENYGLPLGPRSIAISWFSYLLVCLLSCAIVTSPLNIRVCKAGVLRHHSTFQCHV